MPFSVFAVRLEYVCFPAHLAWLRLSGSRRCHHVTSVCSNIDVYSSSAHTAHGHAEAHVQSHEITIYMYIYTQIRHSRHTRDNMEYGIFIKIATKIQVLKSAINTVACFETLCGVRTVTQLIEQIPDICCLEVASYIGENCNWSKAKKLGAMVVSKHTFEDAL